jgi:formate dehydrogenase subunit delta
MGMNATQLIKMANQIGAFFASQPDPVQAQADFAQHLKRQWDPQMRIALYGYIDTSGGTELSTFALPTLLEYRQQIEPVTRRA